MDKSYEVKDSLCPSYRQNTTEFQELQLENLCAICTRVRKSYFFPAQKLALSR